jgi:PAS domain S-box-containing protein
MVIDPGIDELETYESIRTVNFEQKAMPYQELSIHEPPVSHIGQVMKTNKLRLRVLLSFSDAQYERAFIAHYVEFYRRYAQVSLLLGVVLVFGDFLVDYFAHPGVRANFFRVWICVPILFAGLGYSFLQQAKRNWQSTMSAFIVAVALILFWILLLMEQEGGPGLKTWVGVLNFTFLELYCFVILGVQFRFALFAGTVILVAFELAMWFGFAMEKVPVTYWTYHVVTVFILAAAIGWWREYLLRLEYLARMSLDEARQSAEHMTKMKSDFLANTETALRENEAQFDFALRSAQMGVWSLDIINNKLYFDEQVCHLLGFDPETFKGTQEEFFDAVHPDDRDEIREAHSRTIEHNEMYEVEYRVVWSDMSIHYISARGKLVHDDAGHPARINGIAWDITERSQAEEKLRKSEEEFRSLAESMPQIVWVTRKDGWNIYFNQQWVDYTGLTLEQSYGHGWNIPFHPDDQQRAMSAWENATKNNGIYSLECRLRRADGVYHWWLVRGVPLLDETGEIIKWFGTCTDIDGIKNAEKQLQDTLDNLKRAVNTTIQVMVSAVEVRDPYTSGHQARSADLALAIAGEMGLPPEKVEGIRMAGSIHDIGKISIPAEILSKPTKLSEIEFSLIKEHARKGYEMLKDVESPWPLAEIVHQHHERMDGSGYPRKLKGEEICMEARILTVADVVEAMASHRPYRPGLGIDAALNEIEKNRGTLYDKTVADACLRLFREKGFKLEGA